jgi:hypothetical protein
MKYVLWRRSASLGHMERLSWGNAQVTTSHLMKLRRLGVHGEAQLVLTTRGEDELTRATWKSSCGPSHMEKDSCPNHLRGRS